MHWILLNHVCENIFKFDSLSLFKISWDKFLVCPTYHQNLVWFETFNMFLYYMYINKFPCIPLFYGMFLLHYLHSIMLMWNLLVILKFSSLSDSKNKGPLNHAKFKLLTRNIVITLSFILFKQWVFKVDFGCKTTLASRGEI